VNEWADLKFRNAHWQPQRGAQIRLKDMTDTHLMNTIRFLGRKSDFETYWRRSSIYKAMCKELKYRDIDLFEDLPVKTSAEIAEKYPMMTIGSTVLCLKCFKQVGELGLCHCDIEG